MRAKLPDYGRGYRAGYRNGEAKGARRLRKENAALRELLAESYHFFRFGHKALMPWGKALDNWCERAEKFGAGKEAQP